MRIVALALTLAVTLAAPAVAQAPTGAENAWTEVAQKDLAVTMAATEAQLALLKGQKPSGTRKGVLELVEWYVASADQPDRLKGATAKAVNSFAFTKAGARAPAQISQAADEAQIELSLIQIAQNHRIITLLEQLAKK